MSEMTPDEVREAILRFVDQAKSDNDREPWWIQQRLHRGGAGPSRRRIARGIATLVGWGDLRYDVHRDWEFAQIVRRP